MRRKLAALGLGSLVIGIVAACGSSEGSSFPDNGNLEGGASSSGVGPIFTGDTGPGTSSGNSDGSLGTCATGCAEGARCKYDVCIPDLGSCADNDSCPGDSYCDPSDKTCVPYGVPPGKINDPTCKRDPLPGVVTPTVQCEWSTPTDGASKDFVNVYTTPMVADLNLDRDPLRLQPSVVMTTFRNGDNGDRIGMLRVFDGRTCEEQMNIGGPGDLELEDNRPAYGTQIAIGDLDGDVGQPAGHPEIVTMHRMPGALDVGLDQSKTSLIAYRVDSTSVPGGGKAILKRMWIGKDCTTNTIVEFGTNSDNYGPNLWDVDDDGKAEVVVDKNVFDGATGCLLNPTAPGQGQYETFLGHGAITTVADVDLDGQPDLVRADGTYGWDKVAKNWVLKPWFVVNAATQKHGHVAVADLGNYSDIPGRQKTEKFPEVIIISPETPTAGVNSTGTVRVQDIRGYTVFGPVPIFTTETDNTKERTFNGGRGGPPTASDFDGDGQIEFATAANAYYTVYDPDCEGVPQAGGDPVVSAAPRPGGKCMRPDYMKALNSPKVSLDKGILWAQPSSDYSSSETGSSIFDFNGDGKSEAVYRDECYLRVYEGATGKVIFSSPASSGTGQEYPVICDADGDFATEIVVPRAANGPQGGGNADNCPLTDPLAAPDSGAPAFERKGGFVILKDPFDRWVASRPIWNQHAYSITNVNDNASIPKASDVKRNWEQPGLNNFRQNTQGQLSSLALADLTAQISDLSKLCSDTGGTIPLTARVCNRGTNPVQDGVSIAFYAVPKKSAFDAASAAKICEDTTKTLLEIGQCTTITCTGSVASEVDVYVVTDPDGKVADCHPGNNNGASARVLCPVVR